jgi:hypothetical protein
MEGFLKGVFRPHTLVEFPNISAYNVLQLEKGGEIIKMNTDLIHEMVIPAKKKIQSPVVLGLAGSAVAVCY